MGGIPRSLGKLFTLAPHHGSSVLVRLPPSVAMWLLVLVSWREPRIALLSFSPSPPNPGTFTATSIVVQESRVFIKQEMDLPSQRNLSSDNIGETRMGRDQSKGEAKSYPGWL